MNATSTAIPALLIPVERLCFDRHKIDYSENPHLAFLGKDPFDVPQRPFSSLAKYDFTSGSVSISGSGCTAFDVNCRESASGEDNMVRPSNEMDRFGHTHSRVIAGKRYFWNIERLLALAAPLPIKQVPIAAFPELDKDCWFCGRPATIRLVAEHSQRIVDANLELPLILNADGSLMDGGHRLARALLDGRETLPAVQFETMPEPDVIEDERLPFSKSKTRSASSP